MSLLEELQKNEITTSNSETSRKGIIVGGKVISGFWHYFLVFYFWITLIMVILSILIGIFVVLPYIDLIHQAIDKGVQYLINQ